MHLPSYQLPHEPRRPYLLWLPFQVLSAKLCYCLVVSHHLVPSLHSSTCTWRVLFLSGTNFTTVWPYMFTFTCTYTHTHKQVLAGPDTDPDTDVPLQTWCPIIALGGTKSARPPVTCQRQQACIKMRKCSIKGWGYMGNSPVSLL